MKKHAAGFLFFVSVFALSAAGYAVFRYVPIPDIGVVEITEIDVPRSPEPGRHLRITQATADPARKTLALSLSNIDRSVTEVDLTFYKVSTDGVSFVGSVTAEVRPAEWTGTGTTVVVRHQGEWLGGLRTEDNLYVVAASVDQESRPHPLVAFSRDNAAAVLIAKN